jgi:hypothetical protein
MSAKQPNPIFTLADYLSGPLVVEQSLALQAGGPGSQRARRFFALREAFGVTGYATREEAEGMILATLAPIARAGKRSAAK